MNVGSNLVEVQQTLVAGLSARPGLSGVRITYTKPQTEVAARSIWFGDARATASMPTHRGGATQKIEEDIILGGTAQALARNGQTQEDADLLALGMLSEIQQHLAENPALTDNIMWAQFSGWRKKGGYLATSTGHGCMFEFDIRVKARLFP